VKARKRRSVGLGEALDDVMRRADPQGKRYGAQAVAAWNDVVGEEIARHTRGFAMREKRELIVFVDSPAWANQLALMSTELIDRLNTHLGQKTVRALRFTVSRSVTDEMEWSAAVRSAEESYAPDDIEPIPLSDREREQVAYIAEAVPDPELREIALRVMTMDLERKKGARERAAQKGSEEPPETP
jgi:hypothetical protein